MKTYYSQLGFRPALLVSLGLLTVSPLSAQTFSNLHNFADGSRPFASMTLVDGKLYGTTTSGSSSGDGTGGVCPLTAADGSHFPGRNVRRRPSGPLDAVGSGHAPKNRKKACNPADMGGKSAFDEPDGKAILRLRAERQSKFLSISANAGAVNQTSLSLVSKVSDPL